MHGIYKLLELTNNNSNCFSISLSAAESANKTEIYNGFLIIDGINVYGYYSGMNYQYGELGKFNTNNLADANAKYISIKLTPLDQVDMCAFIHDIMTVSDINLCSMLKNGFVLGQNLIKATKPNIFNKCLLNALFAITNLFGTPLFWLMTKLSGNLSVKFSDEVYSKVIEYQNELDSI